MHTAFLVRGATGEAVFKPREAFGDTWASLEREAFGDTRASKELAAVDQCCTGTFARANVEFETEGGAHQLSSLSFSFVANGARIR